MAAANQLVIDVYARHPDVVKKNKAEVATTKTKAKAKTKTKAVAKTKTKAVAKKPAAAESPITRFFLKK